MRCSLPDVLDRLSIVHLKCERLKDPEDQKRATAEFEALEEALEEYELELADEHSNMFEETDDPAAEIDRWLNEKLQAFKDVNGQIWDLESDIRKGREGDLGLEEVGRRAIAIRNLNRKRITIKNEVTDATGSGFKDVKVNHCSDEEVK